MKVQLLLAPLTPEAEVPLSSKSSAAGPFTAALNVTVIWVKLLTVPGAGTIFCTVGPGAESRTTGKSHRGKTQRKRNDFTAIRLGCELDAEIYTAPRMIWELRS